ncbi:hypothetical protein EDI_044490 [Entamoeba dispar SAW760]|uniref:SH3 domain-containing protein n=1 Tax=Entamoeba dispar (strain ATCC PRA-260 / SAW760) TaxID=370354 RepID=B0EHU9_ENTDS|nr:uncharacterized protein EDI_044490 [Entamoeba dispar SAW760]EDR25893.1 hypothetical protein EDI_044490 [Entamoeba dispar SAW760]|eukprot:EDR25893.1 hypothetical protein EDI_044490 [Entamoeba dispar SAW760]
MTVTTKTPSTDVSFEVPLLRGYLTRRDPKGTHSWSKLWYQNSFERPLILECFADEKSTKVVETINFKEVTDLKIVRTKAEDSTKKRYGFQFKYGKHTQKLLTDGEEEGEYWRDGFTSLSRIAQGNAPNKSKSKKLSKESTNEYGLFDGEDFATTLVDFYSTDPGVLSFKKGEIVIIIGNIENGWIPVEFGGKRGWVPNEFIKPMGLKK